MQSWMSSCICGKEALVSPTEAATLISGAGVIISVIAGWTVSAFKIGQWEGTQQAKLDQVITDVNQIKQWDFAKLSSDVSEIKGMFVLRLRE